MLGTSKYADNLFLRLWSYSQRKDRDPLEDFCTEGLVWCLLQSVTFRKRFFNLTRLNFLRRNIDVKIHSQQSYKEGDGVRVAERRRYLRGRFDVAFEAKDFFVALESKVGSPFAPYRRCLSRHLWQFETVPPFLHRIRAPQNNRWAQDEPLYRTGTEGKANRCEDS